MIKITQAAILVGGRGERLRPLTDNIPKPMVEVSGKPFLEHLILLLKENGITSLLFLAGYLGNKIKDYFGDGSTWNVKIDYSFEEKPIGTGGAIRLAKDKLERQFFLLFGDSYLPINYNKMANEFKKSKKKAMLAVYDNADNTDVPFNIMVDKSKGLIQVYNKRKDNPPGFNYCDAGVIIVDKQVVSLIEEGEFVSFEESIYPHLITKDELGYYKAEYRFYDIGTIQRLKVFEQYINSAAKLQQGFLKKRTTTP